MTLPRILVVAPSSYPIYGAEANVNAKIIKILSDAGCIIDLVSRGARKDACYPPSIDELFFSKVNSITQIPVVTKKNIGTVVRHVRTYLKTGYIYKGGEWAIEAIVACEKLIKNNRYDYIYTYDYPSEIVGLYLTKKYGIKWVATWNDPYIWERYPAPYGGGPNHPVGQSRQKLINDIGLYTYRNLFPSQRLADYMLSYMTNMKRESCFVSPHILLDELEAGNLKRPDDTLRIIHAGALGRERDPKTLITGLALFLKEVPDAKIRLSFMGTFERVGDENFITLIEKFKLDEYIERIPPVSYTESLEKVRRFDVCMLIEAACEEGIFLPSKVVDYMQNNKPIFAVSPQTGVLHDMFMENNIDYFADNTSPADIAAEFRRLYTDFENGTIGIRHNSHQTYRNRSVLTTHLNCVFNLK